ncbi:MAG TPA: LPS export ABC transporter ATP-binding protein, partial [Neisseriales bacterium]|nr:LPS export ABC transporter ATP-binding protein [Neisseriales bacterium]
METAQSSTPSSFLDVQHLRKQFKKRVVVKDVSFNVHSNEVIGLL